MNASWIGTRREYASGYVCVIVSMLFVFTATVSAETPDAPPAKPSNLARLLGGATIQGVNPVTGKVMPVSGMTAAIDDDASSGWTPPVGKTQVVVSLAAVTDLSSLTLFAPGVKGSYSVYAADSLDALLDPATRKKVLTSSFDNDASQSVESMEAKYIVIEMDIVETAPIRSVDVAGIPKGGASNQFTVVVPDSSKEQNAGKSEGKLTEVNFAADALGAKIIKASSDGVDTMIDGDTGTHSALEVTADGSGSASINLAATVSVDRLSLAFEQAKGTVRFMATDSETPNGRVVGEVKLDGQSKTLTLETPGVSAESITIVWIPEDGKSPLVVSEIGAFALARVERNPLPDGALTPQLVVESKTPTVPQSPVVPPAPPTPPVGPTPPPVLPPSAPISG